MTEIKRERIHVFMEKFMRMKALHRRMQKNDRNPRFMLMAIQNIGEGGKVMASKLSQKLEVSNAASTQIIDQLVALGWVVRVSDTVDKRITWIELTELGQNELNQACTAMEHFIEGLMNYMGEEDAAALERIMDKLLDYAMLKVEPIEKK